MITRGIVDDPFVVCVSWMWRFAGGCIVCRELPWAVCGIERYVIMAVQVAKLFHPCAYGRLQLRVSWCVFMSCQSFSCLSSHAQRLLREEKRSLIPLLSRR